MFAAHTLREGHGQRARNADDLHNTKVTVQVYVHMHTLQPVTLRHEPNNSMFGARPFFCLVWPPEKEAIETALVRIFICACTMSEN